MAGDPLKKVQAGAPLNIPAEAYNAFIDAARATRGQQALGSDAEAFSRQTTLAKVRNLTGSNRQRFSIVGLNQPIVLPADNEAEFLRQTTFDGVMPASGYEERFAVLLEPLATNKIGLAAVAGVVPVRVYFTATNHKYAAITVGDASQLTSATSGEARILWHEDFPAGPDPPNVTLWALVLLGTQRQTRIVAGTTNAVVLNTASAFQIENLAAMVGTAPMAPLTVHNWFGVGYALGEPVVAIELSSGDWINQPFSGRVYATAGDTFPETLFYKLWGHGTFNAEYHQPVYFEEMAADLTAHGPPVPRALVRAFTAKVTGDGQEKYRALRGTVTAVLGSYLEADHLEILDSGLDPRANAGDPDETITLTIVDPESTFETGDLVWADYHEATSEWEARPQVAAPIPPPASGVFLCSLAGSVSAGSTSGVTPASGATIYKINPGGTLSIVQGTVYNPFTMSITPYSGELFTCNKFYEHNPNTETEAQDKFVIVGQEPRQRLASLDGFGQKKSLVVPEGGSGPSAIQWLGGEC